MKYVALLRGINVGGKNIISMSKIKDAFEKEGFKEVKTYINSGNILFESEKKAQRLEKDIMSLFKNNFFVIDVVVFSKKDIQKIVANAPDMWKENDIRKYVAFLKDTIKPEEVIKEIQPKEGIDFIHRGHRVVYLATKLSGITKSGITKIISKPIYKSVTMRNFNTVEKILALMK